MAWGLAWMHGSQNLVGPDELCTLFGIVLGVQPVDGNLCEVGIGVISRAVFVGEALGLCLHMNGSGGLEAHFSEVELLEDVEHLQGCEALRVCAHSIDVNAAILCDQRFDPFGMMLAKILGGEPAADALEVGIDSFGDRSIIEGIATTLGNHAI